MYTAMIVSGIIIFFAVAAPVTIATAIIRNMIQ